MFPFPRLARIKASRYTSVLRSLHFHVDRQPTSWQRRTNSTSTTIQEPAEENQSHPQAWLDLLKDDFDDYTARAGVEDQPEYHEDGHIEDAIDALHHDSGEPLDTKASRIFLSAKQQTRTNILFHLGVNVSQWPMASWLVRVITERSSSLSHTEKIMGYAPLAIENRSNLPPTENAGVADMLDAPVWLRPASQKGSEQIQENTHLTQHRAGEGGMDLISIVDDHALGQQPSSSLQIQAVGEILNGIGAMILHANKLTNVVQSQMIMAHVLDLLAILHHHGVVPEFTYQSLPSSLFAGRAPPAYFDDLFEPMLSAILDAEWNLFQDSSELATYASGAQSPIPGYQFSSHNNPKQILPFAHEVWLELVLWICLRRGWFRSGLKILRNVKSLPAEMQWAARPWRETMPTSTAVEWNLPPRTLSAELIHCYADAVTAATLHGQGSVTEHSRDQSPDLTLLRSFLDESNPSPIDWAFNFSQSLPDYKLSLRPFKSYINQVISWTDNEPIKISTHVLAHNLNRLLSVAAQAGELGLLSTLFRIMTRQLQGHGAVQSEVTQSTPEAKCHTRVFTVVAPDIIAHAIQCALDSGLYHEGLRRSLQAFVDLWLFESNHMSPSVGVVMLQYAQIYGRVVGYDLLRSGPSLHGPETEAAILCTRIEQGACDSVASELNYSLDISRVSMNQHLRVLISLATAVLQAQREARLQKSNESNHQSVQTRMQLLERYLTRLLKSELSQQSTASVHTFIGMISMIDKTWREFMLSIMSKTAARRAGSQIHVDARLSPNLTAKLWTEIWHYGGTQTVRRLWNTWCEPITESQLQQSPDLETHGWRSGMNRSAPSSEYRFVVRRKIRPNLSMLRVLVLGDRTAFRTNLELWKEVGDMCSVFGVDLGHLFRGVMQKQELGGSRRTEDKSPEESLQSKKPPQEADVELLLTRIAVT